MTNHASNNQRTSMRAKSGIALLFVIIVISAIMSISLGVYAIIVGELRIAGELNRSFVAAYIADQGMERTLYLDREPSTASLCPGVDITNPALATNCYVDGPVNVITSVGTGCYFINVSKSPPSTTEIISRGEFPCAAGDFSVRRAFFVRYEVEVPPPVARWQFDEGFGSNAADSGNLPANNGTLSATLSDNNWRALSAANSALYFDGGGTDYITIPDESSINFNLSDEFSLGAWVRMPLGAISGAGRVLFDKNTNSYEVDFVPANTVRFSKAGAGVMIQAAWPDDGNWHHLIVKKFGNNVAIHIDRAVAAAGTTPLTMAVNANSLIIGADANPLGTRNFFGCIEEAKIWRFALTDAQVSADYYSYPGGPSAVCP